MKNLSKVLMFSSIGLLTLIGLADAQIPDDEQASTCRLLAKDTGAMQR